MIAPTLYSRAFRPLYFTASRTDTLGNVIFNQFKQEVPRQYIQTLIATGAVYHRSPLHTFKSLHNVPLPRRLFSPDDMVQQDAMLKIFFFPRQYPTDHVDIDRCVLFENDQFLVIDKPHGISIGPVIDNYHNNINALLQQHRSSITSIFNPHRLDFQTRGLCVLIKDSSYINQFNSMLRKRSITKRYRAFYQGPNMITPGLYTHYMKPSKSTIKEMSDTKVEGWHECILRVLESSQCTVSMPISDVEQDFLSIDMLNGNWKQQEMLVGKGINRTRHAMVQLNYVDVELITGRTHQIRAQMRALGRSLVGDRMYGGMAIQQLSNAQFNPNDQPYPHRSLHTSFIGLVSYQLSFECPLTGHQHHFSLLDSKQ
ncbi:hypothetical protein SAMD00019534_021750 [Acytostelium subglobosum LB1]|uniref:hypothetical protein n=1 Tax=Acytostelium subglobosum LB1 TaxID=1410327 RepID=UPI000645012F|nr:hypothetical protein SAMD00019534_021750 [Acytostelium subglobosum LB1]GAM19000.1 hypothetical protein SAMD00019534_021750 [Acytostelium subglobosum LB1]|eukprot:XP_012756927.1 hypothetical protein SAMD00019534_021750 [Acytostelium subglobosum LB1]